MIQHVMHNGKSGMRATRDTITNISQNVVNSGTSGYKRLESEFQTMMSSSLDRDSYPNYSEHVATGNGVKTSNSFRDTSQGVLQKTESFSNFAIVGEGYFRVLRADGTYAYTRDGQFNVDGWGRIVDNKGNILDIDFMNGYSYENFAFTEEYTSNINISGSSSTEGIDKDGYIRMNGDVIGRINIYNQTGSDDLRSIGDSLYVPKEGGNMVQFNSSYIRQAYIELSNVDIAEEMTELIKLQRAYQLAGQSVTTADEMWALVNNI